MRTIRRSSLGNNVQVVEIEPPVPTEIMEAAVKNFGSLSLLACMSNDEVTICHIKDTGYMTAHMLKAAFDPGERGLITWKN